MVWTLASLRRGMGSGWIVVFRQGLPTIRPLWAFVRPVALRPPLPAVPLLLFAEPLQLAGLRSWLEAGDSAWRVISDPTALDGPPKLVLWSLGAPLEPAALDAELRLLQERWQPAPVLLLLPRRHGYTHSLLLRLGAAGLLEDPQAAGLIEAVRVLLAGGRVVELADPDATAASPPPAVPVLGLGGWLLVSGLQQIDAELQVCQRLLDPPPAAPLSQLLLEGRLRELLCARRLLLWLWGPLQMACSEAPLAAESSARPAIGSASGSPSSAPGALAITLRQRSADGLWEALRQRLEQQASQAPGNRSGQLLALDGLAPERRTDLLLALLEQFAQLRVRLRHALAEAPLERGGVQPLPAQRLLQAWRTLQPDLRRAALRQLAGTYVQLPREGVLTPVAERLLAVSDLGEAEPDLPDPEAMLTALVQATPLLVEGRLLPPDEPQALLYLELLLANWLIRNAERISAEVLAACAEWPELRRYLLRPDLLSTRNLERLRNQLNAQQRWSSWVVRPIQIYESRRPLYQLQAGAIACIDLSEPRDRELRQLGPLQQLVTLALETRDALAPQLQSLVRGLGDLLVVLLTQVVGRAIGLVGRGILQGMGRGVARDRAAQ